jgi:caffeoyl-CoA O-methyltransferase
VFDDKYVRLDDQICGYVREQAALPDHVQARLAERTAVLGGVSEMQIPHAQGVLLTLLAKSIRARMAVEVGTFTGYSTLAIARGVSAQGQVITCDVNPEWTAIAETAWREAGVRDRIEPRLGKAIDTLAQLPTDPVVDLVFIDADKVGYIDYWELLVPRVRPGGLLLADNVLYGGEAAQETATGNAQAIREFNAHVRADRRVESVLLSVFDGLTIARKEEGPIR